MRRALAICAFAASACLADEGLSAKVQELLKGANEGDAKAQFMLGNAYDSGQGAPRDPEKAMKWYRAAAEQGHAEAQNSLGSGLQAEKKYSEALPWYEKAAAQNHPLATNNLAFLHGEGLGVAQDRRKGFELYSKAAELGWAEAMWNLAVMHDAGELGKAEPLMACVWAVRAKRFATRDEAQLHAVLGRVLPHFKKTLPTATFEECRSQGENWSPAGAK